MRLRITTPLVLMLTMVGIAIALALPTTASAHTVTERDCIQYAWAEGAQTKAIRRARKARCMNYRARHNLCHGVRHCPGWLRVAICESGNRRYTLTARNIASIQWRINAAHDGGEQFNPDTWSRLRGHWNFRPIRPYRYAYQAPPPIQMRAAERWRVLIGGNAHSSAGWPHCGRYF